MKQKTIIQVWGTANTGKSTTIKITREELIRKFINNAHTYNLPLAPGDINDVLICNNIKIGIESMGDYLWYGNLHERLNNLVINQQCDIIICASRVRNDVARHIDYLANQNDYRRLKVTPIGGKEPSFEQSDLNIMSAKQIVDTIDGIMSGII